jgi:hypothetical protein
VLRLRLTWMFGFLPMPWPAPEPISRAESETDHFDAKALFYLGLVRRFEMGRSALQLMSSAAVSPRVPDPFFS